MKKVVCFSLWLLFLLSISSVDGSVLSRFRSLLRPIFPQILTREDVREDIHVKAEVVEARKRKDISDPCFKTANDGFADFCASLQDGEYYDPWNPFCGYIVCKGNKGKRMCCMEGTWMGMSNEVFHNSGYYCRRNVVRPSSKDRVGIKPSTTPYICRAAEYVEEMNMID